MRVVAALSGSLRRRRIGLRRSWGRRAGRACSSISIHLRGSSWPGDESHRKHALLVLPQTLRVGRGCGSAGAWAQSLACAPVSAPDLPHPRRTACTTATSPPARSSSSSPAGRCPCSTPACARSTWRCARRAGSSTSRTWARSRPPAPARSRCCSGCSPTTSPTIPVGGAQYSVLCREDGGVLDDLFTYRLGGALPDGHQRGQPRARFGIGFALRARGAPAARRGRGSHRRLRDARRAGPARAGDRAGAREEPLPARMSAPTQRLAGAEVLVCGTGYTGEDGVELLLAPTTRRRCGMSWCAAAPSPPAWRARHAAPGGLLSPLRQRPLHRARADRGRAGVVLQGGHRLHRRRRRARRARRRPGARSSPRSRSTARDRAPGKRGSSAAAS